MILLVVFHISGEQEFGCVFIFGILLCWNIWAIPWIYYEKTFCEFYLSIWKQLHVYSKGFSNLFTHNSPMYCFCLQRLLMLIHIIKSRAATSTDFRNRSPKLEPYPINRTVRIPLWGPMFPRVHGQRFPNGTLPPIIASCLIAGFKSN